MYSSVRRFRNVGVVAIAGVLLLSGCATRRFVRNEVGVVNDRVSTVETAGRENAERIDAVDRRAQEGIQGATTAAGQANTAAQAAQTSANNAQRSADTASQGVQQANNRINTVESRINSLDQYTLSGQPQSVTFRSGSAILSDEAMATLDQIASQVSGQQSGYIVELQGFTDSQGGENFNVGLSQRRAEAVLRYLVTKNVPLFRIAIVGLGEANPVGPNETSVGRQQNRRVEVRVLRSAGSGTTN